MSDEVVTDIVGIWISKDEGVFCCTECGSSEPKHLVLLFESERVGESAVQLDTAPQVMHFCVQCWPNARAKLQFLTDMPGAEAKTEPTTH